jgi:hypothetical protein
MLDQLKIGERIFLISQIFDAKTFLPDFSVNEGIVKSFNGEFFVKTSIIETEESLGSPIFDLEGKVLGLSYIYGSDNSITVFPIAKIKAFAGL